MNDRDRLVATVSGVPARLAAAAQSAAARPTPAGEWTPQEVVRHLIAVELEVWHPRLDQLAQEDHPHWPWVEPDRWWGEPDASLERLLVVYSGARASTVAALAALDADGWVRTGIHATFGVLDTASLMTRAIDHDEEHLASFNG